MLTPTNGKTQEDKSTDFFGPFIFMCGLTFVFVLLTISFGGVSGVYKDRYNKLQTEAVQKGYAHWKVSVDGNVVEFIWNDVDFGK